MSPSRRLFLGDEELGKKDDDHDPTNSRFVLPSIYLPSRLVPRRRRILPIIAGLILLYILFKHAPRGRTDISDTPILPETHFTLYDEPTGAPPLPEGDERPHSQHYYDGPVKFYQLAKSIYSLDSMRTYDRGYDLVLFAAADLGCVSDLLPLACAMGLRGLNKVHLAVMGWDEVPLDKIKKLNGYNSSDCPVIWHDARPDYAPWSTEFRMVKSVKTALGHLHDILRPGIVITRASEDHAFFEDGIRTTISRMGMTHINLPKRASNFKWIADLDSSSLAAWENLQLEILVIVSPRSSGPFRKLIGSLRKADFMGVAPGLTIELPEDIDPLLMEFLKYFNWPPHTNRHDFTLRHRIHPSTLTEEEAAIRTFDALYPKDPRYSHVLVLSPQVELAPSFYHFLIYSVLKYKHSSAPEYATDQLLGISLELPSSLPLDGNPVPIPDALLNPPISVEDGKEHIPTLLSQVPNSHSALYFGDKWREFQSFLARRLDPALRSKQQKRPKIISKLFPSWMEYMLELMRARGYYMLYPGFSNRVDFALATVHNELYRIPEEYESAADSHEDPGLQPNFIEKDLSHTPHTLSLLIDTYPASLPGLSSLPILLHTGETASGDIDERTTAFRNSFRKDLGGCSDNRIAPEPLPLDAEDLFC
ncbi:hypothetical protein FQN57_003237 [Myotisia sp. PD_48]|nr:hypothetical protein FQN57_003237 [Myotisia sp. PD_48]